MRAAEVDGTSRPLLLGACHFACRPDGSVELCGADFEAEILRSDLGTTFGLPPIAIACGWRCR